METNVVVEIISREEFDQVKEELEPNHTLCSKYYAGSKYYFLDKGRHGTSPEGANGRKLHHMNVAEYLAAVEPKELLFQL